MVIHKIYNMRDSGYRQRFLSLKFIETIQFLLFLILLAAGLLQGRQKKNISHRLAQMNTDFVDRMVECRVI